SWISFFIGTSPSGITREALNIFLFLWLKKIVEKNKKITCKVLMREQFRNPRGLYGPHLTAFPLVANEYSHQFVSFFF
ncbi:MAG: hypothetical protein JXR89_10965, partial [Deltaproteobacteria bacterium]|nr:hypothetical protein [Deltaproteobacteria bacterium]